MNESIRQQVASLLRDCASRFAIVYVGNADKTKAIIGSQELEEDNVALLEAFLDEYHEGHFDRVEGDG